MLVVNDRIQIHEDEFTWSFVRAGGPGGQNVNKVASKAVMRWNVRATTSLPDDVKARFETQQRRRITLEGELIVTSQRYRDQERNRQDCLEKLQAMVLQATVVPKPRKKTKPSRAAKERRITNKKRRSQVKRRRQAPSDD